MAVYFVETSALVKRYAQETGTAWVESLVSPSAGSIIYIAQVSGVEAVAALTLRARRGSMTLAEAGAAITEITDLRRDIDTDYVPIQITTFLLARAMDLVEKHGLRGYDSLQLSSALQVADERAAAGGPCGRQPKRASLKQTALSHTPDLCRLSERFADAPLLPVFHHSLSLRPAAWSVCPGGE